MIAQVWENKVFENKNNKEKHLGKLIDRYENKNQNQIPNDSLFFDFSNTLKQIKEKLFGTKTLSNLLQNSWKDGKIAL